MAHRFGRFWLQEKIGHGGMAEVYRATVGESADLYSFEFAVKILHKALLNDPKQRDMFAAEAYLAKLLVHPNILRTYESAEVDTIPYIAMEFIDGVDLFTVNSALAELNLRWPAELAVLITLKMLRALDYIHGAKGPSGKPMHMIHRDLTPSNIFISFDGGVKVGDFGVARVNILEPQEDAKMLKGKLNYMPPEVLLGESVEQNVDLWAVGVMLFEMLAGRRLYQGMSDDEILRGLEHYRAPGQEIFGSSGVAAELVEISRKMLHVNPGKRPASAADAYRQLKLIWDKLGFQIDEALIGRYSKMAIGPSKTTREVREPEKLDGVTGLPIDEALEVMLQVEIDRSKRHRRAFSLLLINLDNFSSLNNTCGPEIGDEVLRHLARRFFEQGARLRTTDIVGRRSSDTFLVLLPETNIDGAMVTAERIRDGISRIDVSSVHPSLTIPLRATVGVSSFPSHGATVGALLEAADVACFQGKELGKNRVVLASSEYMELKTKISEGAASESEIARWAELREMYENARRQDLEETRWTERFEVAVEVTVNGAAYEGTAYSEDVSLGGMRVKLGSNVKRGDELELKLRFDAGGDLIDARARVVWQRRDGMVGLEFVELAPYAIDLLSGMLR